LFHNKGFLPCLQGLNSEGWVYNLSGYSRLLRIKVIYRLIFYNQKLSLDCCFSVSRPKDGAIQFGDAELNYTPEISGLGGDGS